MCGDYTWKCFQDCQLRTITSEDGSRSECCQFTNRCAGCFPAVCQIALFCVSQDMSGTEAKMIPPPKNLLVPMNVPQKLLMGPGPSNASPRVLAAGAMPVLGHMHTELWQVRQLTLSFAAHLEILTVLSCKSTLSTRRAIELMSFILQRRKMLP